jgi:acetylglutamate kinase
MSVQERLVAAPTTAQHTISSPCVVKIGGSMLDDAGGLLDALADLWRAGQSPVVVHGGGPAIDAWLRRLGIVPQFAQGRRVTDASTLSVVRAVLAGEINSLLVAALVARGVPAVGLSGLAAGMLRAECAAPEQGFVGIAPHADAAPIRALLAAGFVPIVAPLALGPDATCLNVNADDAATAIARDLEATHLFFVSDVPGVRDAAGALCPRLTATDALALLDDGTITGGMIPKMQACLAALADVGAIHILDEVGARELPQVIAGKCAVGTRIVAR